MLFLFKTASTILVLFLALFGGNAFAFDGPIALDNQYPLALRHKTFGPRPQKLVTKDSPFAFSGIAAWTNTFDRRRNTYRFDTESRTLRLDAYFNISERLEVFVEQPIIWLGGGFTDHFIDQFHKTSRLPRGDRDRFDEDVFALIADTNDGKRSRLESPGTALGNLTVGTKYVLLEKALSLLASLSLPTAKESFFQDSVDIELGLLGSHQISESIELHYGIGGNYFFDERVSSLEYHQTLVSGFFGGELLLSDNLSLLITSIAHSELLANLTGYPDYVLYLDVGLRYALSGDGVFAAVVREDPSTDGSSDVSLAIEFAHPL